MRKLITALAVCAILTAPAYAQGRGKGSPPSEQELQEQKDQKKRAAEIEKAHKAALERIPEQKKADPWANMR